MKFEKVSYKEWVRSCTEIFEQLHKTNAAEFRKVIDDAYNNIKLPCRSTEFSAGYDFYNPFPDTTLVPNKIYKHPTGIRWTGEDCKDKVLLILPRSGLGCKYGFSLRNTVGVIDADYQYATNEGHIQLVMQCDVQCILECNKSIVQGIITNYFTTDNDDKDEHSKRTGGFGSTG